MVEVTPQEYQKIVSGKFDRELTEFNTEELVAEIIRRSNNVRTLSSKSTPWEPIPVYAQVKVGEISITDKEHNIDIEFSWTSKTR